VPRPGAQGVSAESFWAKAYRRGDDPDACWIWGGNLNDLGYGRVRVQGRLRSAHRVAYELAHGPIPEDAQVRHRCPEPACVRPEHLLLVNPALTPKQIEKIRQSDLPQRHLARLFTVSQWTIWHVRRRDCHPR
jgi:hypothetical protein